jgi:hypothetical protein
MNSAEVEAQTVYISLGCDCAPRHQLTKNYLSDASYPFDWIKTNNILMICDVIEKDFSIFFSNYKTKQQSDNFINFDTPEYKSKVQLKLENGIIMPHEAYEDIFNVDEYTKKYMRRIERFRNIIRNKNIKKIFIRTDEKKVIDINKEKLLRTLDNYGCVNYEVRFVSYSDYVCKENFTWQRDYIDWTKIFS